MTDVSQLLGLSRPPIAVGFLASPPPGVQKWEGGEVPAGCSFWRAAQEGRIFYTVPADHYNCAVGAYTHQIPLPEHRTAELTSTVGFMVKSGYLRMEEVPGIPTLPASPSVVAYGPVGRAPFAADVVIVSAKPAHAMLLYEAAARSGAAGPMPGLGRPACAAIPLAMQNGSAAISLGCKGNRTFTGLPDDEMYLAFTGAQWEGVAAQLAAIVIANQTMESHYTGHKDRFATTP
jgi:uncharacterized protein (DUF169 family)